MKPILRSLILLASLWAAPAFAVNGHPDGSTWLEWSPAIRLGYVRGYMEGMGFAGTLSMGACLGTINYLDSTKVSGEKWKDMCLNDKTFDYDGISMGQFVDGTDAFYRDYSRRNLEVGFAFQYVRDRIRGKSQTDLDAEVAGWKNISTDHQH